MCGHLLRELPPATIAKVLGNPSRPEGVVPDPRFDSDLKRAATDHPVDVGLSEGIFRELPRFAPSAANRISLQIFGKVARTDVSIQTSLEIVISRIPVPLAAFRVAGPTRGAPGCSNSRRAC
jgi:predicted secreted protein